MTSRAVSVADSAPFHIYSDSLHTSSLRETPMRKRSKARASEETGMLSNSPVEQAKMCHGQSWCENI